MTPMAVKGMTMLKSRLIVFTYTEMYALFLLIAVNCSRSLGTIVVTLLLHVALALLTGRTGTTSNSKNLEVSKINIQGSSLRRDPGCENAAGKLRQK